MFQTVIHGASPMEFIILAWPKKELSTGRKKEMEGGFSQMAQDGKNHFFEGRNLRHSDFIQWPKTVD